jgi:hypothetical protein
MALLRNDRQLDTSMSRLTPPVLAAAAANVATTPSDGSIALQLIKLGRPLPAQYL